MHELLWVFDEIKLIQEEVNQITNKRTDATNKHQSVIATKAGKADEQEREA